MFYLYEKDELDHNLTLSEGITCRLGSFRLVHNSPVRFLLSSSFDYHIVLPGFALQDDAADHKLVMVIHNSLSLEISK